MIRTYKLYCKKSLRFKRHSYLFLGRCLELFSEDFFEDFSFFEDFNIIKKEKFLLEQFFDLGFDDDFIINDETN